MLRHFPAGQTVYFSKELVSDSQWPLNVGMEVEIVADPTKGEVVIRPASDPRGSGR